MVKHAEAVPPTGSEQVGGQAFVTDLDFRPLSGSAGSASGLLVGLGRAEDGDLVEMPPREHQADRQTANAVHGHRDRGMSGQVEGGRVADHVERLTDEGLAVRLDQRRQGLRGLRRGVAFVPLARPSDATALTMAANVWG